MTSAIPFSLIIFGLSISAIPVTTCANKLLKCYQELGLPNSLIALTGVVVLVCYLCLISWAFKTVSSKNKSGNLHVYVFSLFSITAVIDLGISLELYGYMTDFLSEYLRSGEPYLFCSYGAAICVLDGIVMYAMYLYMIHAITNKKNYRQIALYWSGFIVNSMIVLLLGISWGKHGIYPSTSLNIPYIVFPVVIAWQFLNDRPKFQTKEERRPLAHRPLDALLIVSLVMLTFITILRGVAAMGNSVAVAQSYLKEIEPLIWHDDPCPFARCQILLNLFYLVPVYLLSIHALVSPSCSWITDLTLIHAGAAAQGQLSHMLASLHGDIPKQFQIPQSGMSAVAFWIINALILVVPHLLLIRCLAVPGFFCVQTTKNKNGKNARYTN